MKIQSSKWPSHLVNTSRIKRRRGKKNMINQHKNQTNVGVSRVQLTIFHILGGFSSYVFLTSYFIYFMCCSSCTTIDIEVASTMLLKRDKLIMIFVMNEMLQEEEVTTIFRFIFGSHYSYQYIFNGMIYV